MLSARLPYMFALCRFAQYVKCIERDRIGAYRGAADIELDLRDWLAGYVLVDPSNHGEALRAMKPLAGAEVQVSEVEGQPGVFQARLSITPHYQLEAAVTLSTVVRLP